MRRRHRSSTNITREGDIFAKCGGSRVANAASVEDIKDLERTKMVLTKQTGVPGGKFNLPSRGGQTAQT